MARLLQGFPGAAPAASLAGSSPFSARKGQHGCHAASGGEGVREFLSSAWRVSGAPNRAPCVLSERPFAPTVTPWLRCLLSQSKDATQPCWGVALSKGWVPACAIYLLAQAEPHPCYADILPQERLSSKGVIWPEWLVVGFQNPLECLAQAFDIGLSPRFPALFQSTGHSIAQRGENISPSLGSTIAYN